MHDLFSDKVRGNPFAMYDYMRRDTPVFKAPPPFDLWMIFDYEGVLRYRSPLQWVMRTPARPIEMAGQTIPPGQLVLAMLGSANRDPRQFPDANRFDISRLPNPHVAFGHGIHFCMGAPLSRLEAKIALTDLLTRTRNMTLASDEPWEPRKGLHVYGPTHLPIRFEPA